MLYYERKFKKKGYNIIIGVDEAGIGPLAGPVVAAAVALEKICFKNRIDDSKKLTANQREKAFLEIVQKSTFGLGIVNEKVIDRVNVFCATRIAMEKAIEELINKIQPLPEKQIYILIDGNIKPNILFPFSNVIKGDAKSKSIASASILAKVTRDRIMNVYDKIYPHYGFLRHKGYPTEAHKRALRQYGLCMIHRKSFSCV